MTTATRRPARERLAAHRDRIPREWVVGTVFVLAMFMTIMDTTIVNTGLPTLAREFSVGTASIEWVITGYLLSLAVSIPASGWIGDRFGTKRTFLVALAVFTTASLLCGLSSSFGQLVAFRVLQGVGGGMLAPVGTAMLFREFPPERRARAAQILVVPTAIAPTVGPVLGGFLIDNVSWHWIFFVNVPMGIGALVFAALFLHEHREREPGSFDLPGLVLSGGGLALVLFSLSQGPTEGWTSARALVPAVLGLAALGALVPVELRRRRPLLDVRLFEDRLFRACNLAAFFAYAAFIGVLFLAPLFLQQGKGLDAFESGLTTFTEALGVILGTQTIVPRLYRRFGPRRMMMGGLLGNFVVMSSCAFLAFDSNLWVIRGLLFAIGFSQSFLWLSVQTATFARISHSNMGRASAIFQTTRQTAGAIGVAILATILASNAHVGGSIDAFRTAFVVAGFLALLGAISASFVRDRDAEATMSPRAAGPPLEVSVEV